MGQISDAAADALRAFNIFGVPASGASDPEKQALVQVMALIDEGLSSLGLAGAVTVAKATRGLLLADLAHPNEALAVVYDDPTSSFNGIYVKSGDSGSGSWAITGIALPSSFAGDLATVLSQLETVIGQVAAADAAAAAAASSAQTTAALSAATTILRDEAQTASDTAIAAAEATGASAFFDTHAEAVAGLGGLTNNQVVEVLIDETQDSRRSLYRVESGALVFKVFLNVTRAAVVDFSPINGVTRPVETKLRETPSVGDYINPEAAAPSTLYVPDGVVEDLADYPLKTYVGPGAYSVDGEVYNLNQADARGALFASLGRIGDLKALFQAIANGAATVVFACDSIGEGISQITYEDSWAGLFEAQIREQFPSVNWIFINLSIPGTGSGELDIDSYIGANSPTPGVTFNAAAGPGRDPPNYSLWPNGTTIGKPWHQHIQDAAPDLLIVEVGVNNLADPYGFWGSLDGFLINRVKLTWAKVPSIAVVTPSLPSRIVESSASGAAIVPFIQANADAIRSMAEQWDFTCIDANRLFVAHSQGVDVAKTRNRFLQGFADFASWLLVGGGARPSASPTVLTAIATGIVLRPTLERNVTLSVKMSLTGSQVGGIWYRSNPTLGQENHAYVAQVNNAAHTVILYFNSVAIASSLIPIASDRVVTVVAEGAHHQVWVDGVKYIDKYDFQSLFAGRYGLEADGGAVFTNFSVKGGYRRAVGVAHMPEPILLGAVNDFDTNIDSLGGDTIHHPSIIGHFVTYFAACQPLVDAIRQTVRTFHEQDIYGDNFAITGDIIAGDTISVHVNGTESAPQVTTVGGDATNVSATTPSEIVIEINDDHALVELVKNGTTVLCSCTLRFPATGTYLVKPGGSSGSFPSGFRHVVSATARRKR